MMAAYKVYFGQAYKELREKIGISRSAVALNLSDREIARIERTMDRNTAAVEFWTRFGEIQPPVAPARVGDAIRALRSAMIAVLDRKASAPLEIIAPDAACMDALNTLAAIVQQAAEYNAAVETANAVIAATKEKSRPKGRPFP